MSWDYQGMSPEPLNGLTKRRDMDISRQKMDKIIFSIIPTCLKKVLFDITNVHKGVQAINILERGDR